LWLIVVAFGVYHGLNPAMGWPLAVANGMAARRDTAVFATLAPLGIGHLLAMAAAVLPFALLAELYQRGDAIRIGAGVAVVVVGSTSWSIAGIRASWRGSGRPDWPGGPSSWRPPRRRPDAGPVALGLCAPAPGDAMLRAPCRARDRDRRRGDDRAHDGDARVRIVVAWLVYRFLG